MSDLIVWQDLHMDEAEKLDKSKVIIIPLGTIEPHGNHLPLKTDLSSPELIAKEVCKRTGSILGVSIPFGWSAEMTGFPGTLTLKASTYIGLIEDIAESYYNNGFKKIVFINGHGGNPPYIQVAMANLAKNHRDIKIRNCDWYSGYYLGEERKKEYKGNHAYKAEVEMMMLADKKSVKMDKAVDYEANWTKVWKADLTKIMPKCVDGEPTKANEKDAKELLEAVVTKISEIVEEIKKY
ncbi:MAG: creatininase family protein [archaeon]|nr:MAG: creatininase family protein [archaeon]